MKFFWKYIFPPLYGLLFYTIIRLVSDIQNEDKFWDRPFRQNAIEIIAVILFCYPLTRLPRYFIRRFEKKNNVYSAKTIFLEFGTILLAAIVIATTVCAIIHWLTHDPLGIDDLVIANIILALFLLLHYAIARGNSFIRAYIEQKLLLEKIKTDQLQTELKFLKAQYHPHFLFNALNTIYFQMDENVADAKKSVEKFSELLRYQLYDQQQTVAIRQEMHYLKNFILLQQTRTSEKLKLEVNFDNTLDGQQVYPLLFLPLVENAFKYVGGEYHLHVQARQNENGIEFKVENSVPAEIPVKKETGIGLENLKRRLELLYPGRHTLLAEKKGKTFIAALNIELN
ncbi:MAG TPA: histidine kinase [Chitinophagaceae bacterium]|jgi:sensor histidine kinase YesM